MSPVTTQPRAVVTGATSGIGRWIALGLAKAGFSLTLIARDAVRADKTQRWIQETVPGVAIDIVRADLSSLAETRAAAAAVLARHPTLDLLVNNAGLICHDRQVTPEGHEKTLATNLLSPLVLTEALLPALQAPARIVMIGSSTADRTGIDPDDLELKQNWRMTRAYARSKLALLMMSRVLAERLKPSGVTVTVVHPGLVATSIVRHGGIDEIGWRLLKPFSLTPEQGAATPLYACLSPDMAGRTGLYLKRQREAKPNPLVFDTALVARVEAAVELLL